MSDPVFLTLEQVVRLHQKSIEIFGGSHGYRDKATLEGAVIQPQNIYYYNQGDFFDIAAANAYHIAESQGFVDGNKRTAVAAALMFLANNGVDNDYDSIPIYDAMISVAKHEIGREELAENFRKLASNQ